MKNKWVLSLGLLLVFGLAGCDTGDDGGSAGVSKTLIISGVPTPTGSGITGIVVGLKPTDTQTDDFVSFGYGPGEGTVTIQLKNRTENGYGQFDWTGSGEYYLLAWKSSSNGSFNGNGDPNWYTQSKVNFQTGETSIDWSSFSVYTP
jgi:hypothetical protein